MSVWGRITDFLALRRNTTLLLVAVALALTGEKLWLVVAFVVRGLKEFGEPARKALIIAQARPELRARTYGAYYLIRDCVVTTGSFLGAWLWSLNPQANFIGAAICGALGTLWFWSNPGKSPARHSLAQPQPNQGNHGFHRFHG